MEPSVQFKSESILGEQVSSIQTAQRLRIPLFGIKAIACVILLALGSGASLHSALLKYVNEQETSIIQVDQRNVSAWQATTNGNGTTGMKTEDEDRTTLSIDENQVTIAHNESMSVHAKETSSSPELRIAHYEFPSLQQRLQYYMGDWYNKPNWTLPDSDCKLLREETDYLRVHDVDIMMHTSQIKKCIHKHERKGMVKYCRNAYDAISNTLDEADSKNNRWIFHFGDSTKTKGSLPIVTKARRSALSKGPRPIVWLLNKERHYKDLESYQSKIVNQGKEVPWSEKIPKVFWRGTNTGSRYDNLAQWVNYNDGHTDIAFSNVMGAHSDFRHKYVNSHYFREKQSLLEMNRYKYLLSVEGNDVATGLKWMLYSNSVVFMSRPTVATWAMEDLLVPFVHYIPLANDYSNLLEMVKWANEHDEACQEISKRATDFIKHLWISKQAKKDTVYLQKALVTSYVNQFDSALSSCAKDQSIEDTRRSRPNASETQVAEPATTTSSFEKMHKQLHKFAASPNYNVEKKKYEIGVSMNRGTGGLRDTDRTLLADIYSSVDSV